VDKEAKVVSGRAGKGSAMEDERTLERAGSRFERDGRGDRGSQGESAMPEEYGPAPDLRLERWGEFNGDRAGRGGFRVVMPDGRWLPFDRSKTSWWEKLGLFIGRTEGISGFTEDVNHSSFDYGQPLRFIVADDQPLLRDGERWIEIRNQEETRTAGFVPTYLTRDVLRMAVAGDFAVISLNGIWARSNDDPFSPEVSRVFLLWMMFRMGRLDGIDDVPPHPPIGISRRGDGAGFGANLARTAATSSVHPYRTH